MFPHYEAASHVELISFLSQIATPVVTAPRTSAQSRSSSRTSIIAGSTIAGITLLILALATLFCLQRRRRRGLQYWALSRSKRLPSRSTFRAGEEIDLPLPSPPFVSLDQTDPFATHSSHRNSSAAGSVSSSDIGGSGGAPLYPRYSFSRSRSPSSHTHPNVSLSASLPPPSTSFTPHVCYAPAPRDWALYSTRASGHHCQPPRS